MPECSMVNWLLDIVVESDAFNLLTVLYKLDTASYRDCTYMSCCHWKGVPLDLYQ